MQDREQSRWELTPDNPTLEVIHTPEVMEDAMKQLAEKQGGPLTGISSTQGFFSYKVSDELKIYTSRG